MASLYRYLALSDAPIPRAARRVFRFTQNVSIPAPRFLAWPLLQVFLFLRATYYFVIRVAVCEPLFKAYCKSYGRRLRTGVYVHWVQGRGELIIGDDVLIDGKSSFSFAARYSETPTLSIGDHCGIGFGCSFVVGKQIKVGSNCRIASDVHMFDSPGHPTDPESRLAGLAASPDDVRPITIGDNVWVGSRSIIFPGVSIGDNSVIAAGSVVMSSVPPNTVVAGNPARQIRSLAAAAVKNSDISQ